MCFIIYERSYRYLQLVRVFSAMLAGAKGALASVGPECCSDAAVSTEDEQSVEVVM